MPSAIVGVVAPSTRSREPHADGGLTSNPTQASGNVNRMSSNSSSSPSIRTKQAPTATINPNNANRNRFGFHSSPKRITSSATGHASSAITSATVHPPPRYSRRNSVESNKSAASVGNETPPAKPVRSTNAAGGGLTMTAVASLAAGGIENNNNSNDNNTNNNSRAGGVLQGGTVQSNVVASPFHSPAMLSPRRMPNTSSAKAGYLCVKTSTAEDLESAQELLSAMQYCGTHNYHT